MIDYPTFIANFPEFTDTTKYPQSQFNLYMDFAGKQLDQVRWGRNYDMGVQLFTAHKLVLAYQRARAAANGAPPGQAQGPVQSKGVDKVNVSYDSQAISFDNAGYWNATSYGIEFYQLARWMGSGGAQIC